MLVARRNQDLMPSLFNELLDWSKWNVWGNQQSEATPKMNVSESDTDFQLELCVPGLRKEDLSLSIDPDNNLVVEMHHKEEKQASSDDQRRYLRREFTQTQFKQVLSLPENVKREAIRAKVDNGILQIVLPKVTEEEKKELTQTIQID